MITRKCPHCTPGVMEERSYDKSVRVGRRVVRPSGLLKFVCASCVGEVVTREQFKINRQRVLEAIECANAKKITPDYLRNLRERYQLSQRTASQLFGAGINSFAKWETEQISISAPASLLLQCAAEVPGVVDYLAELSGVVLESPIVDDIEMNDCSKVVNVEEFKETRRDCVVLSFSPAEAVADPKSAIYNPVIYRKYRSSEASFAK